MKGWMTRNVTLHYQWYPFLNLGHYALFPFVNVTYGQRLAGFYGEGLEALRKKSDSPYRVGHPFFWCSNNFAASVVSHVLLYVAMTNDMQYWPLLVSHRCVCVKAKNKKIVY